MRKITFTLLAIPFALQAHTACLDGAYTHEFTQHTDEIVWKVVNHHGSYQLIRVADNEIIALHALSKQERIEFWQRMQWVPESAKGAECAGDKTRQNVICELSEQARKKEPTLQNMTFFHADPISGVMKIMRVDE